MRTRNASLLDELRTGGIPDALAGAVESFKAQFLQAASAARAADPLATDAEALGEAASQKTLATE
jgi:F-type H+-transporting ATPase subunit alpha